MHKIVHASSTLLDTATAATLCSCSCSSWARSKHRSGGAVRLTGKQQRRSTVGPQHSPPLTPVLSHPLLLLLHMFWTYLPSCCSGTPGMRGRPCRKNTACFAAGPGQLNAGKAYSYPLAVVVRQSLLYHWFCRMYATDCACLRSVPAMVCGDLWPFSPSTSNCPCFASHEASHFRTCEPKSAHPPATPCPPAS
jgi:hypothetical protein